MQERIVREAQGVFDIHGTFDTNPALLPGPMASLRQEFKTPEPFWVHRRYPTGPEPGGTGARPR